MFWTMSAKSQPKALTQFPQTWNWAGTWLELSWITTNSTTSSRTTSQVTSKGKECARWVNEYEYVIYKHMIFNLHVFNQEHIFMLLCWYFLNYTVSPHSFILICFLSPALIWSPTQATVMKRAKALAKTQYNERRRRARVSATREMDRQTQIEHVRNVECRSRRIPYTSLPWEAQHLRL